MSLLTFRKVTEKSTSHLREFTELGRDWCKLFFSGEVQKKKLREKVNNYAQLAQMMLQLFRVLHQT